MGPNLSGPFREVVGLGSMSDCLGPKYKVIDIEESSICGGGRLARFYINRDYANDEK